MTTQKYIIKETKFTLIQTIATFTQRRILYLQIRQQTLNMTFGTTLTTTKDRLIWHQ